MRVTVSESLTARTRAVEVNCRRLPPTVRKERSENVAAPDASVARTFVPSNSGFPLPNSDRHICSGFCHLISRFIDQLDFEGR